MTRLERALNSFAMAIDPKLVDKRILRRTLSQGKVDPAEYERWIAELPDLSDKLSRLGDDAREEGDGRDE